MTEVEILNEIAKLLWKNEIENYAGMRLMEKEVYLTTKHPLGRAGFQTPDGPLNLLIKGKLYEVKVVEIELEE